MENLFDQRGQQNGQNRRPGRFNTEIYQPSLLLQQVVSNKSQSPIAQKLLGRKKNTQPVVNKSERKLVQKTITHPQIPIQPPNASLYKKQLEISRNYQKYIKNEIDGKELDKIFPTIQKKTSQQSVSQKPIPKMTSREERRLKELLPKRKTQSKQLSLNENPNNVPFVTCARCSRRHPVDYHERQNQQRRALKQSISEQTVKQIPTKRSREVYSRIQEESEDSYYSDESDLSGFIDDDDKYQPSKIQNTIRKMFNYDPRKYRDIDMEDDRNMESNAYQILREEKFSSYIGRKEDEEEWKKIMQEEKRRKNN